MITKQEIENAKLFNPMAVIIQTAVAIVIHPRRGNKMCLNVCLNPEEFKRPFPANVNQAWLELHNYLIELKKKGEK